MLSFTRWKATLILMTAFAVMLLATPNLMPQSWVDKLPRALRTHMTLGLDLQGGVAQRQQVD